MRSEFLVFRQVIVVASCWIHLTPAEWTDCLLFEPVLYTYTMKNVFRVAWKHVDSSFTVFKLLVTDSALICVVFIVIKA